MELQSNETILELWGDLSKAATIWAAKQINLGKRRDATIQTGGLDFGGAGKHPDVVICDDIVNEKNYASIKVKRAAKTKVQAYYPILPPWGTMIVSGTRFAHNDVYGWILEQNEKDEKKQKELLYEANALFGKAAAAKREEAKGHKPQWDTYIRSARDASGNLFFPTKLTEAFLNQQRRSIEAKWYASWYDNRPDVEGMQRFRLEYLKYFSCNYSRVPIPVLEILNDYGTTMDQFPVRVTMTIDPTVTASGTSDWTGVTVVATDAAGTWWVLLARRLLEVPSVVGEEMVKIIRAYHPSQVHIESAQADVDMVKRIQRAISEENLPVAISSYHPLRDELHSTGRRKKAARIEGLEPRFANGHIWLQRNTCEALYDQYRNWPDLEHDDVFDALSMQYGIAKACKYTSVRDAEWDKMESDDEEDPSAIFGAYRGGSHEPKVMARTGKSSQRLYGT
jgi:phage terminase large subunit-like protein